MAGFVRIRSMRLARPAAGALLVAALAVGCGGGGTGDQGDGKGSPKPTTSEPADDGAAPGGEQSKLPAALTGQKLDWGSCDTGASGGWQCATMKAPLDYDKPDGETIGIELIRNKARDSSQRLGSLLFNFGGPGGSGVSGLPPFLPAPSVAELHQRYDLVSFDPRGVAASEGVRCRDDRELEKSFTTVDVTPDTAAEEKAYFKDAAGFGAGCERRAGKVLPYVGTTGAARDMDLMRQVLGDKKLNYLGYSYGTELGGVYAHLFPKNVGRMVLDAVVDPSADSVGHAKNQTSGFQRALENYLKSEGEDPEQGTEDIAALLKRIDAKPLPGTGGRELNESLATTGITEALYSEHRWPELTAALSAARSGKGGPLLALADSYNNREPDGSYGTQSHAQRAISCADAKGRPTAEEAKASLAEFRKISPVFGPFLGWDTAGWCHEWPVEGEFETPEVSAPGAAPMLVVGTTGDSATPYEGARRMADELGKDVGVLLTFKGEGHGAYAGGNACVDTTVNGYLLDHEVPEDGKVCSS
ncbi:alpha/beta hydrolase [Streptomyces sp. T-3]|nr:alpha/beta hydrolase [Streptomyces sp. T-3]